MVLLRVGGPAAAAAAAIGFLPALWDDRAQARLAISAIVAGLVALVLALRVVHEWGLERYGRPLPWPLDWLDAVLRLLRIDVEKIARDSAGRRRVAPPRRRASRLGGEEIVLGRRLAWVDLRGAALPGAELVDADLRGADLRNADLRFAKLAGADLREADLRGADLREADVTEADLRGARKDRRTLLPTPAFREPGVGERPEPGEQP